MKKYLFFLILFFPLIVKGDEPPPWNSFQIKSPNKKFTVEVKLESDKKTKEPRKPFWWLIIRNQGKEIWRQNYAYDGYPTGYLSNDGMSFVYLHHWYDHSLPVIKIYQKDKDPHFIQGKEINFNRTKLVETTSHYLWLQNGTASFQEIDGTNFFTFKTIDGKEQKIKVP